MKFSLFGIPITIQPMFFVIIAVLGGGRFSEPLLLVSWVVVAFVSVMFHELGHALAFRRFGHAPSIMLYGMGGLTRGQADKETTLFQDLVIALAGPGFGFALGGLTLLTTTFVEVPEQSVVQTVASDLLWINIGWSVFNLVPMLPLDGGHVLLVITRVFAGKTVRAMMVAQWISLVLAAGGAITALVFQQWWVAILAGWFGLSNFQGIARVWRGRKTHKELYPIELALQEGRNEDAIREADRAITALSDEGGRAGAWFLKAAALINLRRAEAGLRALDQGAVCISQIPVPANVSPGHHALEVLVSETVGPAFPYGAGALLEQALLDTQQYEIAVRGSQALFERTRKGVHAYNVACCLSRLGKVPEALQWLRTALETGFADLRLIDTDPDLASVRSHPGYAEVRSLLSAG